MKTTIALFGSILLAIFLTSVQVYGGILSGPFVNSANGHSYYLLTSNIWTASQAEAVSLGGNLVTINDVAENDWVFETFSAGQRNLWIGLYDPELNGAFSWLDGTVLAYSNWDTGPSPQPDRGNEHWVFMARSDLGLGLTARKWHDLVDGPASAFPWIGPVFGVVERPFTPVPKPPSVLYGPVTNCANGHIYYLLAEDTWENSQCAALRLGGNLATINDQAEQDWVFSTFASSNRSLWIGLRQVGTIGNARNFQWVNGEPLAYTDC